MRKSQVKKLFIPIYIPIYDQFTAIAVNLTDEEILKGLIDANIPEEKAEKIVEQCTLVGNNAITGEYLGCSVVRYPDMKSLKDLSLIAHESLHVTFSILDYIGMGYCEDSEEAYTYVLGYIMNYYRPYI